MGNMEPIDFDDPSVEEVWCAERRSEVVTYLQRESLPHGRISDCPAWHVAPYVSIWAIESAERPGWVGLWVICGDLPTDYVSADTIKHPREALRTISERWQTLSGFMERGEEHPELSVGNRDSWSQLGPLLRARAKILAEWVDDEESHFAKSLRD